MGQQVYLVSARRPGRWGSLIPRHKRSLDLAVPGAIASLIAALKSEKRINGEIEVIVQDAKGREKARVRG